MTLINSFTQNEKYFDFSNEYKDFNKQSQFIKETVEPVRELWLEKELKR